MLNFKNRGINIDSNTKCALKCPKCIRENYKKVNKKIPGREMPLTDFKKLINYFKTITFCGQISDPTSYSNLINTLKICKIKNLACWIHTASSHKKINWYEEAFKAALEQFKFLQNMADGGRAGYNVGGMTGMAAPQQTSQTIQESPTQDLTYAELRSRLPNSISDQVVQLLANSKQALLDFAEIRTQQDVDQFNQQYDVTLTLPQEG